MSCAIPLAPAQVTPVVAKTPVRLLSVQPLSPIMLNATLGQAGLWTGEGAPGTIIGATVGDEYLDTLTGTLYRLSPGA